jgi:hypothetical protein
MNTSRPWSEEGAQAERGRVNRRRFLRGTGALMALPAFESLIGSGLRASAAAPSALPSTTAAGAPIRTAFVYFPNGAIQSTWWPKAGESPTDFTLSQTMKPLEALKSKIQVLGGLDQLNATSGPDGPGDHARASGSFLTSVRVRKTAGANIHAGVSIDQVIANRIGHLTRFPSLELSCDAVRRSGNCDSGYSCAYQYNLAWRSPTTPVPPEPNPRLVFERLFGAGAHGERKANLKKRQQDQRSLLDYVLEDARSLQRELASRDRQKLDDFMTSIREVETRITQAEKTIDLSPDPDAATPAGIPSGFEDYINLMYDMMVLAFQTDSTRVATFLLANEGSNRAFPEIGIAEGHHSLTHHRNQQDMMDKVASIDLFYVKQFGRFLEKLEKTKDSDGRSLLDNTMIVYGSGNSDGNRHTHNNLPLILAGGGGGLVTPGRYVKAPGVPMSNMFLTMADRLGVTGLERFGDSTGRYDNI